MTILYVPLTKDPIGYFIDCAIHHETVDAAREPDKAIEWLEGGAWCRKRAEDQGGPKLTKEQRKLYKSHQIREIEYWTKRNAAIDSPG